MLFDLLALHFFGVDESHPHHHIVGLVDFFYHLLLSVLSVSLFLDLSQELLLVLLVLGCSCLFLQVIHPLVLFLRDAQILQIVCLLSFSLFLLHHLI